MKIPAVGNRMNDGFPEDYNHPPHKDRLSDSTTPLKNTSHKKLPNENQLDNDSHLCDETILKDVINQNPESVPLFIENCGSGNKASNFDDVDNVKDGFCTCGRTINGSESNCKDVIEYSQLCCGECVKLDSVSRKEAFHAVNPLHDDSLEISCEVSLSTMLESIPLAYNPMTKQLHVINSENYNGFDNNSKDDSNDESFDSSSHSKLIKSNDCDEFEKPDLSTIPNESIRNFIDKGQGSSFLSRADESSFSSISSLSTNTDISGSAFSSNDLEVCGINADKESQSQEQTLRGSEAHSFFHDGSIKPKKSSLSKFLNKSIFSWKFKESENVTFDTNAELEANTYVVSPPNTSWKIFSKSVPKIHSALLDTSMNLVIPAKKHQTCTSITNQSGDCVANSTTALILENRPANLPAKSTEEAQKHKQEYDNMVQAARKKDLKEAKQRKKQLQLQLKQEEALSNASKMWSHDILPNWEVMKSTKKVRDLWWFGFPPNVRGRIWRLAIGNHLNVTEELYEICVNRARDRISLALESASICSEDVDATDASPDKEGSVDLIKLDVSRTFPHLCIFQKGGPYYDILHSILGAYVCYRPDVGYVQGMSFIAAILILNLDVADAFICFSNLLNKPCQMAFFRLEAHVMKSYFMTYEEFFKENLLKLYQHFDKQKLATDLYLMDWIYTLFSKSLPLDVACRVWDIFFRDGEEFLFRAALGILHLYQDTLLEMEFIHLGQFLKKIPEDLSSESLFKSIEAIRMLADKKNFSQILALNLSETKE